MVSLGELYKLPDNQTATENVEEALDEWRDEARRNAKKLRQCVIVLKDCDALIMSTLDQSVAGTQFEETATNLRAAIENMIGKAALEKAK